MIKRFIALTVVLLFSFTIALAEAPTIQSKAAILINADSGQVLYRHNADAVLPMASTTKIMTALVLLEEGFDFAAPITTNSEFVGPGGTHIAIDHAETFSGKDLIYALLVHSANDAAVALAEANAGSVEAFVEKMNQTATRLGAVNTHFVTPHGLDADGHATTAADLAIIAAAAMQNRQFRDIVQTKKYTIPATNKKDEPRNYLRNGNLFLHDSHETMNYDGQKIEIYDPRIDGVKTGYTSKAQKCLVSSFVHNGARYIVVVLGAADKDMLYGDSKRLVDYASEDFKAVRIVTEGDIVTNIKVKNAESSGLNLVAAKTIDRAVAKDASADLTFDQKIDLLEADDAPILMGRKMGEVTYLIGDEIIAKVDLLAQRDIETRDLVGELTHALSTRPSIQSPLEIFLLVLKLLISYLIWRFIIARIRERRAKQVRDLKLADIRKDIHND